jgi:hypothetical protein
MLVIGSRRGHQCSETTLTGESRFHISPPRGFEPVSLVAGSKQVVPGPVRHGENHVRLQALHTTLIESEKFNASLIQHYIFLTPKISYKEILFYILSFSFGGNRAEFKNCELFEKCG